MHSIQTVPQTDPHDTFAIDPSVRIDQASPDPVHEVLSLLSRRRAQTAADVSSAAPTPVVDTTFRATAVDTNKLPGDRPAGGGWVRKTSVAFLFALCSAVAAAAWTHHGDVAKQMIAGWVPPFVLASFAPSETPPLAGQPPVQAADAEQAPVQPGPAAGAAPAADSAQSLPSMAHDVAAMGQQIEQLKATIEQLRDSQTQMSRDIARNAEAKAADTKPAEQNARPRVAALPPRPVATPPRKPRPPFPQAATSTLPPSQYPPLPPPQPAPPPQFAAEPDGEPVTRPPMPLH
jgi:hypothetical protein